MVEQSRSRRSRYTLWDLVKDNRQQPWDMINVACNPQITLDILEENMVEPWKLFVDSSKVPWDEIKAHPEEDWNWQHISYNIYLTWEFMESIPYIDSLRQHPTPWDWRAILSHPNITWDIIMTKIHPSKWDWKYISRNPNITWENIESTVLDKVKFPNGVNWDWHELSKHPNITWEIIEANSTFADGTLVPWDWFSISVNPNITWDIIELNFDRPWKWASVVENPNITWDIIEANPFLGVRDFGKEFEEKIKLFRNHQISRDEFVNAWDWPQLSSNPNIPLDIIKANANHELCCFTQLSENGDWYTILECLNSPDEKISRLIIHELLIDNPNITYDNMINNLDIYWRWDWKNDRISLNPNITKLYTGRNMLMSYYCYSNPNITKEFVQKFPKSCFRKGFVGKKPTAKYSKPTYRGWRTVSDIPKNMLFTSNTDIVLEEITPEFIQYFCGNAGEGSLMCSPKLTIDIIEANTYLPNGEKTPWNWKKFSGNPNITWEFIVSKLNIIDDFETTWDWFQLSKNPSITWEIIEANLFLPTGQVTPWKWSIISRRDFITWDKVYRHPEIGWDLNSISKHRNITWYDIEHNLYVPWDWIAVSQNPNITFEIIEKNLYFPNGRQIPWNWDVISSSLNITWENVRANMYFPDGLPIPWNWWNLSSNPSIPWEAIKSHRSMPWDWNQVSLNPNITPKIVRDNPWVRWKWSYLSQNSMDQPYYRMNHHKKYLANQLAATIYDELTIVVYHPNYHPANRVPINELADHPFVGLSPEGLKNL